MSISDLICEVYRWPRPNQIANGSMTYGDGVMLISWSSNSNLHRMICVYAGLYILWY